MMNTNERVHVLSYVFDELQDTTSLNEKRRIVNEIPEELKEDFEYCVECLNGLHIFGYKYYPCNLNGDRRNDHNTIKDLLEFLQEPIKQKNLTESNIAKYISQTYKWHEFLEPIVNRELKLGIGKSILPKDGLAPMLAKKYEGKIRPSQGGYYITEKLDGNRCIARYDGEKWVFTSRNGKPMHVNFDMSGLPKEFVYDGEKLAPNQVAMSSDIYNYIAFDVNMTKEFTNGFNSTSGLINRHSLDKKLIYNIFDVMIDDAPYKERRCILDAIDFDLKCTMSTNVRILPVLARFESASELDENIKHILHKIVKCGGEGLMINLAGGLYNHKRSDQLLKYKEVQTMDMKVTAIQWGTGKYLGLVGAIHCYAKDDKGNTYSCDVGSGLSDNQRLHWANHPEDIVGKIVEVAYFSTSQSKDMTGSEIYSLRFPRLKSVRKDKNETSEY